jgi:hypothetical protein
MAGLRSNAVWDGQVLRTAVSVPGAGWPGNDR